VFLRCVARCVCIGVCVSVASIAFAQTPSSPQLSSPLTFDAAIARAIEANPTLAAARLRRGIDLAGLDVARERPNPEAHIELERETPKEAYGVAFPLELGGKRRSRIAVSDAAIKTGEAEVAITLLDVRTAVRRAYFGRAAADARLVQLDELRGLAVRVRDAARQRFEAGSAPRLEVVQADLALAQVENEATAARAAADAARVQLNALLALPLDTSTPLATTLDAGTVPTAEAAIARAQSANVELVAIDRRLDEQRARVLLARSLQVPDVTPEATLTRNSEPEFQTGWRAAITVGVPLFTRHRAGVRVEEATLAQVQAEREATRTRIAGEVTSTATLAEAQRQQYLRYRDQILPQALEVERMADDAYRLGQTGIAAYLQALQATRDVRLKSLQAAADFQDTLADLERAIGAALP
jgi:outer membrane protein, heavy metal efflux system